MTGDKANEMNASMKSRTTNHELIMDRRLAMLSLMALAGGPALGQEILPATKSAPASGPRQYAAQPPEEIQHERVENFLLGSSRQAGEPWRIYIGHPAENPGAAGSPVLYLLDGNTSFPLAWHVLQALQEKLPNARKLALVGIGYPANVRFDVQRRFYDLTPLTDAERMGRRTDTRTGGQDVFLDFIEHDLRSAIAGRLTVKADEQALFGHSLGGLLVMHALYTRPSLFQTWIAADPSFWWNGGSILDEETAFLLSMREDATRLRNPAHLLIEQSGGKRDRNRQEGQNTARTNGPDVPSSAQRLAAINELSVWHHRFENESHGSMIGPSIRDGVAFFLGNVPPHLQKM